MGVDLALISALDVLRDPRWGRSEECFSEDPYLVSRMAEAVAQGLVFEERINEAAKRILIVKFRRGLFENPYVPETNEWQSFTSENYPQVKELAEQSVVLLKNQERLLPLNVAQPQRIALVGSNVNEIYNQLGDYTPPLRQAVELAEDSDVVIAVLGGTSSRFTGGEFDANGALKKQDLITMDCGENVDDCHLRLPGEQLELLHRLKQTGKKIVTILIGGRPYEMSQIDACSDAILCAFYPGLTGGKPWHG